MNVRFDWCAMLLFLIRTYFWNCNYGKWYVVLSLCASRLSLMFKYNTANNNQTSHKMISHLGGLYVTLNHYFFMLKCSLQFYKSLKYFVQLRMTDFWYHLHPICINISCLYLIWMLFRVPVITSLSFCPLNDTVTCQIILPDWEIA